MIKAVLFDMDGVLIDAKEWHYETLNDALAVFGLNISRTEHLAVYDGLPTRKKLEMLSRTRGLSPKLHDFLNTLKQQMTYRVIVEKCRPVFHHEYALGRLQREGKRLVVCSNSVRSTVEAMMQQSNLLKYLDFLLSNQDVAKAKPHPEIYLTAIERLKLQPHECLILEDNEHGIQAARASGAHVMVVGSVNDVNYERIGKEIAAIEAVH
ncbi:HAD superfamily hydrolase (TIGR01509 family)/HAD superfamily hydrolase (TIGR01549 family) [Rhizobium sp. PP-F2F-G38]|uniref:HAD family phosphatase n=1 Tax=Ferranicluibacter rubi TaxID=2715133 RepID=A0AA44CD99_9HYPH|nr:HAD family phosphatase [Ferranicluibacter rubi]PYE36066.1 HAD superfamily hydrolase (TIGR01509 family)/HAD superfamily hydrolase (TIGR01549 family) [Rhizobium sp. PP-WC-1G-195]PYE99561.1 HAD superfamily hydrolase (TIGR01509 family)/HAD superfamily hydrolase (TIGR01549 family) [Rhizobium sp. PP-F2F-G38]TCP88848.1 HAD superfamily hydrolase (TIGR01509 family)/HAD superfamily hydrolase (TIGR01549 family) [Rhizobium sp. PP-CC-2G-626]TCQ12252.1 HAD superfamily hydrolase (TIGR01509 family)/HAD supe